MSGRSAIIVLRAEYSRLPRLEHFVDAFTGGSAQERMRAKIVASELFDNLITHGRGVLPSLVIIGLRAGPPLTLTLSYRSTSMLEFLHALEAVKHGQEGVPSPRYDAPSGLYRGFGLTMCVRLSSRIEVRRGLLAHRVSVVF